MGIAKILYEATPKIAVESIYRYFLPISYLFKLFFDKKSGYPIIKDAENTPLRVKIVDDSVTIRKLFSNFFTKEGYEVILEANGVDALNDIPSKMPDIVFMDIEMPIMDGYETATKIRENIVYDNIPIVFTSSRISKQDLMKITNSTVINSLYDFESMSDIIDSNMKAKKA